ncbi:adenosine deaminase [Fructilactobacillus frigidiflavus]|uniref:adenosine deaminase n=1 Tax=Fructilactobacillus frigidiflavus TaxID=3242688 RepID=UPI003757B2E9
MLTRAEIQRFPKAELHCHLDGSIRPHTLREIARGQGEMIHTNLMELTRKMVAPADAKNLEDYLQPFDFVLQYLQTEAALERAAYDVMEQAHQDGVRYIEIRFAPSLSMEKGLTVAQTIKAVAKGIARAEATYDIDGNLLVCGMRTDQEHEVAKIFAESKMVSDKLVGVDLAGPEQVGFVDMYKAAFPIIVDGQKVQLTLHAGECGCADNVLAAIKAGSKRIGHGIAAAGNEKIEKLMLEKGTCIEGCPTSNVQTHAIPNHEAYPLQRWLKQGQQLCLNTDNRTVSDTTLTEEYFQMAHHNDLTKAQLRQCNLNAINNSFASAAVKQKVADLITNFETE